MAIYEADSRFTVLGRDRLFDSQAFRVAPNWHHYDVSASGDRFVMVLLDRSSLGGGEGQMPRITQILNFLTELEEKVGG